jgi:CRISPR-associated endonuclease/helicase Cas3
MKYYAHSGNDEGPERSDWQELRDHLLAVANGAELRASVIDIQGRPLGRAAYLTGLFHDVGKYRPGFQWKIRSTPVPNKASTHHKQAGAAMAWSHKQMGGAFAITGHHGGLPSLLGAQNAVKGESGATALEELWPAAIADLPLLANVDWPSTGVRDKLLFDLETRVIFSCLVDADWANTAEHDRQVKKWPEEPAPPTLTKETAKAWLMKVRELIREKVEECKRPEVKQARDDVLQAALKAATELPPGLFTLAVPTGGGKTLSALAFAVRHALQHSLRRVIYVAPFLSILDQNARVIRRALGEENGSSAVFEHHSLSDTTSDSEEGDEQSEDRRAAASRRAENWDSPVIVTTNVQFFESLFSNDPGQCRKLHNIAKSVVVLDECQAIPNELLAPTCAMLTQLVEHLGCTIVLATATQPTFDHPELLARGSGLKNVRPIVPAELNLFARLGRVNVTWPRPDEILEWDDVARMMIEEKSDGRRAALCVVNTRRAAREIFQSLRAAREHKGGIYHLSTWMCPAHRLKVLDTVKARLRDRQPCYLVSTQLIEAGVDVDFPLVLREMAPLEAIIQAAGRCNREGTLNSPEGFPGGRVIVFCTRAAREHPRRYYPSDPWYLMGRDVLEKHFLSDGGQPAIDDPYVISAYFNRLLNTGDLDKRGIRSLREEWNFPEVSRLYRLIDEGGRPIVIASWVDHVDEVTRLLEAVRERPTRSHFRALAPFQVNLRFPTEKQLSYL